MATPTTGFGGSEVMYPVMPSNGAPQPMIHSGPMPVPGGMGMFGTGGPRGPEVIHGAFNQTWLVNCIRRRWLAAVLLGTLMAAVATIALMYLVPLSASTVSYIEVKSEEPDLLSVGKSHTNPKDFETFQETQKALIKSQFVLKAALQQDAIRELDSVVYERPDELTWLLEGLNVNFSGEILEVRWDGEENPDDMKKVVDAVVEAYEREVVQADRTRKKTSFQKLAELKQELTKELQEKVDKLLALKEELGGADSSIAQSVLNMLINDVRLIQSQQIDAKQRLVDIEVERTIAETQARDPAVIEQMVEEELSQDPVMQSYKERQYVLNQQLASMKATSFGSNSSQIEKLKQQLQLLDAEVKQYESQQGAELKKKYKSRPNVVLAQVMAAYVLQRNNLVKKLQDLDQQYEDKVNEIQQKGAKSGVVAMLEAEIEQLTEIQNTMDFQLRRWQVEDETDRERIRVMAKAYATENINEIQRYSITGLGAVFAFCATCYCVALVEFRRRRLNSPNDVDDGLGIRVLGVLPSTAGRKSMALGSPVAAQISEAIDNVRATIMHDSTTKKRQIVMITSPETMEGTTTVASHLALSLARAGRRTLLIDGDLRDPALHKLFGMPMEDGLSELLRSEIEISDAVRPTNTEGLWLMSAGMCDMDAVQALATDQLQPIFEKLRGEFDFIVIDVPPVLGLSDAVSIGQYSDGAVLTVLRDHSGVREIYKAAEQLRVMGISVIGSVVNGVPLKADRRAIRSHSQANQPRRLGQQS